MANIDPKFLKNKLAIIILGCIVIMKSVGLISDFVTYNPIKYKSNDGKDNGYFAYEPTVSFSKENNIYVFIIDRFDSFWCDEFLAAYPDVKEELEGFTFYQNNISAYTNTFPSIVNMFTHVDYDGTEWYEYFDKAWSSENVFSILKNNGYNVNLILDEWTEYGSSSRLSEFYDNKVDLDDLESVIDKKNLGEIIFKLSFLRMVPYAFKGNLEKILSDITKRTYIDFRSDNLGKTHMGWATLDSDIKMYDYTKKAEFNSDSEKKVMTVIHLNGAHDINHELNWKAGIPIVAGDLNATIRANFETVLRYIRASRELGVYDNTTFIILGDHGRQPSYDKKNSQLIEPIVTALLIKPAKSENSEFKTDSKSELSNTMLMASLLEYAGVDNGKYGDSYNDIIAQNKEVKREFHTYKWYGIGSVVSLNDYEVIGNARDFSNWKISG